MISAVELLEHLPASSGATSAASFGILFFLRTASLGILEENQPKTAHEKLHLQIKGKPADENNPDFFLKHQLLIPPCVVLYLRPHNKSL